jgi:hypothetical protein
MMCRRAWHSSGGWVGGSPGKLMHLLFLPALPALLLHCLTSPTAVVPSHLAPGIMSLPTIPRALLPSHLAPTPSLHPPQGACGGAARQAAPVLHLPHRPRHPTPPGCPRQLPGPQPDGPGVPPAWAPCQGSFRQGGEAYQGERLVTRLVCFYFLFCYTDPVGVQGPKRVNPRSGRGALIA